jgi:carbonic anhydrase
MPTARGATRVVEGRTLDFNALRPRSSAFYRYEGSLTTPPCSETVDWVVMDQTIQASAEQINAFERVYPMNARPVQALNRRFLLRSR